MADNLSPADRARNMRAVRTKRTAPEERLARLMHAAGMRFRRHAGDLPGTPDIANRRRRAAVFVHGCFWHGHTCAKAVLPATNRAFWAAKIEANQARDARTAAALTAMGYTVVVVWACELGKGAGVPPAVAAAWAQAPHTK